MCHARRFQELRIGIFFLLKAHFRSWALHMTTVPATNSGHVSESLAVSPILIQQQGPQLLYTKAYLIVGS